MTVDKREQERVCIECFRQSSFWKCCNQFVFQLCTRNKGLHECYNVTSLAQKSKPISHLRLQFVAKF